MNVRSGSVRWLMLIVMTAIMAACSSGGDGDYLAAQSDGPDELTYTGNENPATLDGTNIEELTKGAMGLGLVPEGEAALPTTLSRSLGTIGMTASPTEGAAVDSLTRSLSDSYTTSGIGSDIGYSIDGMLQDSLDEVHDRLVADGFPNNGGTAVPGAWTGPDENGRYSIPIALDNANHCSDVGWTSGSCVDSFAGNGTITVVMALPEAPAAAADLQSLMIFLDATETDYMDIAIQGDYSGANTLEQVSLAMSGSLHSLHDSADSSEENQASFTGDIVLNEENLTLTASGCTIGSQVGYAETGTDYESHSRASLAGDVNLVVTIPGETQGDGDVITVAITGGQLTIADRSEAENSYGLESSTFSCSGKAAAEAKRTIDGQESTLFDLDLDLGTLALTSEEAYSEDVEGEQATGTLSLDLQASLQFSAGDTAFSVEDLALYFQSQNSTTYGAEGASYANNIYASLSGGLAVEREGQTVFEIRAPEIHGEPNMTFSLNRSDAYDAEQPTIGMTLHVGRLTVIDQDGQSEYAADFNLEKESESAQASLTLVASLPTGVSMKMDDYHVTIVPATYNEAPATQVTVSGTFYHSQHGSVSVSTPESAPFIFLDGGWPVQGTLLVLSGDVTGRLSASETWYQVAGDMNGDSGFDDPDDFTGTPTYWPAAPWDMIMELPIDMLPIGFMPK